MIVLFNLINESNLLTGMIGRPILVVVAIMPRLRLDEISFGLGCHYKS